MSDENIEASSEEENQLPHVEEQEIALDPPKQRSNKNKIIGVTLLIVCLAFTALYLLMFNQARTPIQAFDLQRAQVVSDSLYNELKNTLAIYKQENEDLYVQIARKESTLESQYAKIQRLIAQAKRDKTAQKTIEIKVKNLVVELDNLQRFVENQTLDLEELRVENKRLKKEKEKLDALYEQELQAKIKLQAEETALQDKNRALQQKVNTASVLRVHHVRAEIMKIKSNGTYKKALLAKNGELINICFDIIENDVCEPGPNRFFLRVIHPKGSVIYDSNRGSGQLRLYQENQDISFTISKIFDYDTGLRQLCMEWYAYPSTYFTAGEYRIELYNKGRLSGRGQFSSK
jgi:DNA repair exonuclease SbcCD ATPase subunit